MLSYITMVLKKCHVRQKKVFISPSYLSDTKGSKLQTLVYDILPLEEGAGKRCTECEKVVLTTSSSPPDTSVV